MTNDEDKMGRPYACEEVQLTATQSNEIIEEKLVHLKPVFERALEELLGFKRDLCAGDVGWKKLLQRAKRAVS